MNQDKAAEIEFFDTIADTDSELCGMRLGRVIKVLSKLNLDILDGQTILEAGCATGIYGAKMVKRGATVYGVDISPKMIQRNLEQHSYPQYIRINADLEKTDLFKPNSFDYIVSIEFLHHFINIEKILYNFSYWLKPFGTLCIFEPNGAHIGNKLFKLGNKIVKAVAPQLMINNHLASVNESNSYSIHDYEAVMKQHNLHIIYHGYMSVNQAPDGCKSLCDILGHARNILEKFLPRQDHMYMLAEFKGSYERDW